MNKANKAGFSKTSLKELTDPLALTNQTCCSLVIDDGEVGTRPELAENCRQLPELRRVPRQSLSDHPSLRRLYSSSPKDLDHIRRTKNSCCDLQIRPDMIHLTPREKSMYNPHNKNELIHLLSSTFRKRQITVEQCDNDVDTSIVRAALVAAKDDLGKVSKVLCRYFKKLFILQSYRFCTI